MDSTYAHQIFQGSPSPIITKIILHPTVIKNRINHLYVIQRYLDYNRLSWLQRVYH